MPNTVSVDFVKSDFEGLLPTHFRAGDIGREPWWDRKGSRNTPAGLNDLNKEVHEYYVGNIVLFACTLLINALLGSCGNM